MTLEKTRIPSDIEAVVRSIKHIVEISSKTWRATIVTIAIVAGLGWMTASYFTPPAVINMGMGPAEYKALLRDLFLNSVRVELRHLTAQRMFNKTGGIVTVVFYERRPLSIAVPDPMHYLPVVYTPRNVRHPRLLEKAWEEDDSCLIDGYVMGCHIIGNVGTSIGYVEVHLEERAGYVGDILFGWLKLQSMPRIEAAIRIFRDRAPLKESGGAPVSISPPVSDLLLSENLIRE